MSNDLKMMYKYMLIYQAFIAGCDPIPEGYLVRLTRAGRGFHVVLK